MAKLAQAQPEIFEERRLVLEYLAMRVPRAYLQLADLVTKIENTETAVERAKEYVRRFLENAPIPDKREAWLKLAYLCECVHDTQGEIHAISEAAVLPTSGQDDLAELANRLNNRIRELRGQQIEDAWSPEVKAHIGRVIQAMERQLPQLTATDCSRLAWLYLNVSNTEQARRVAEVGIKRDPMNVHCRKLMERLDA